VPHPAILPLKLLGKLRPSSRDRQRVEVAKRVHSLRHDEMEMSDSDLWNRLGAELAEWAHSGVVDPLIVDELSARLGELDPRRTSNPRQDDKARTLLRASLDDLYDFLIINDRVTRYERGLRHAFRARKRLKGPKSGGHLEQPVAPSLAPIASPEVTSPNPPTSPKALEPGPDDT